MAPGRFATGMVVAWASFACCATAHAAGWVAPATTIFTGGGGASSIQESASAEDAQGNTFAIWNDLHTGTTDISERPAGGPFPASPTILAMTTGTYPTIVVDAAGDKIVVWSSGGVLEGEQQAPGGSFQSLAVPTTSGAQLPELAAGGDGSVILVWQQGGQLMYSMRRPGGSFGPGGTVPNSTDIYSDTVAMDAAGDTSIAFVTSTFNTTTMTTTASVLGGYWDHTGSGFNVPSAPLYSITATSPATAFISSLHLAMSAGGDSIATWEPSCESSMACPGFSSTYSALFQSIRKAGTATTFAVPTSLASTTSSPFGYWEPTATFDASENAIVAWAFNPSTSFEIDQTQIAVATGAATSIAPVSSQATGLGADNPNLSIASLSTGDVVIAYSSSNDTQVSAAIRPTGPPGTAFGTSTQLSDVPGGSSATIQQGSVEIATSRQDAFVTWLLYQNPSTLQGAAYAGNPPVVTVTAPATATVGKPISISASALGDWTAATVTGLTFGDGGSALGSSASHTYTAPGTYTITAVGTDGSGNTGSGTAQIVVSAALPPPPPPRRCVVPKLKGKTLAAAKRALKAAGCRLGRVTRPRRRKDSRPPKLVVVSQSLRAGTSHALETRVNIRLGPAPKPKKKHRRG